MMNEVAIDWLSFTVKCTDQLFQKEREIVRKKEIWKMS